MYTYKNKTSTIQLTGNNYLLYLCDVIHDNYLRSTAYLNSGLNSGLISELISRLISAPANTWLI